MKTSKWYLILNPVAGNGKAKKRWPKVQKLLHKTGIEYDFGKSEYAGHAIELAQQAVLKGYKNIAAVGGDGTANEVVNGIFEQSEIPTENITFAIIPVGSGNDWIKTHKIPKNYKKAILLIAQGNKQSHDVGKVFYHTEKGEQKHRYFINVAGLAYDAFVTKATAVRPKWGGSSWFYYLYLIISCIRKYEPRKAKVIFDDQEIEHAFFNITIGQCIYNGGGTQLIPHANPNDGLFAMTLLKDISPWEVIFRAPQFYSGKVAQHKEAVTAQAKSIRIEALDSKPAFVEVDGEWLGQSPIDFEMIQQGFQVIVP